MRNHPYRLPTRTSRKPDIVYVVRPGDWNEELRYSLRSLVNLPHGRVWIVGHKPPWVTNVHHWARNQSEGKHLNATKGLVEITDEIGASLTKPFLLFNDDFYVMRPIKKMPILHMGPVGEVIDWYARMRHIGAYYRGMQETYQLCKALGIQKPLSYELHVPMPIYREPLLDAWKKGRHLKILHIRTLYGNLAGLQGTYMADVKVYRGRTKGWEDWPFLSTNDDALVFPEMRKHLRTAFPTPSPYEVT